MKNRNSKKMSAEILSDDLVGMIGAAIVPGSSNAGRVGRLRARVLQEIDRKSGSPDLFETIRNGEGSWIQILPQVEKKTLKVDEPSGTESYLLRLEPGASTPRHLHTSDEVCFVIEGDLTFGDLRLESGDYHFARAGSEHVEGKSVGGALLFIHAGIESANHSA